MEKKLNYEEATVKSYSLLPHHIAFLERLESNQSLALRKALDELIKRQKKDKILNALMPLSLALIFFLVAYIAIDIIVSIVSLGFGVMLSVVGIWRHINEIH
jgi:hypothetical protein